MMKIERKSYGCLITVFTNLKDIDMASEAKTRKAKHTLYDRGGMKSDGKCKRTMMYQKRQRMRLKRQTEALAAEVLI